MIGLRLKAASHTPNLFQHEKRAYTEFQLSYRSYLSSVLCQRALAVDGAPLVFGLSGSGSLQSENGRTLTEIP